MYVCLHVRDGWMDDDDDDDLAGDDVRSSIDLGSTGTRDRRSISTSDRSIDDRGGTGARERGTGRRLNSFRFISFVCLSVSPCLRARERRDGDDDGVDEIDRVVFPAREGGRGRWRREDDGGGDGDARAKTRQDDGRRRRGGDEEGRGGGGGGGDRDDEEGGDGVRGRSDDDDDDGVVDVEGRRDEAEA